VRGPDQRQGALLIAHSRECGDDVLGGRERTAGILAFRDPVKTARDRLRRQRRAGNLLDAFLQGVHLERARLGRSNFNAADLRESDFSLADFSDADLQSANLRQSTLRGADLERADFTGADLWGADLSGAQLSGAKLAGADLSNTNLANIKWREIAVLKSANIYGVKNAPEGFADWAVKHGAVQSESNSQ